MPSFCTNCGLRLGADASRCISCGAVAPLGTDANTQAVSAVPDRHGNDHHRPPSAAAAALEVVRGRNLGARFLLADQITLGRSLDSDIFLDDISVSRDHATIADDASGRFVLTDAGSLNGTYLNDERVERAVLRHGDIVQIGLYKLVFVARG